MGTEREHRHSHGSDEGSRKKDETIADLRPDLVEHGLKMFGHEGLEMEVRLRGAYLVEQTIEIDLESDSKPAKATPQKTAQAEACRLAIGKHLSEFQNTVNVATKLALYDAAGLGEAKLDKFGIEQTIRTAGKIAGVMWSAAQVGLIGQVAGIAKEELLGDSKDYVELAQGYVESALEEEHVSLKDVSLRIIHAMTVNADKFVTRARASFGKVPEAQLASAWDLVHQTRQNMTVAKDALDEDQKEVITTAVLELLTGIQVGGAIAERMANTMRQQALADFALIVVSPEARHAATQRALSGTVPEETTAIAKQTGDSKWIESDKQRRASVLQP